MQFCTAHSKDLESAFASLSTDSDVPASAGAAANPPPNANTARGRQQGSVPPERTSSSPMRAADPTRPPEASGELSMILMALRKLREALLATSESAPSPVFSQRVHVFNIRLAILALHPPSYYPSLQHLLTDLHTAAYPLPTPELSEMTTYMILDLACRQNDLAGAYRLRAHRRQSQQYESKVVDSILASIITSNWVGFWRIRRKVDGYIRTILSWAAEDVRRTSLKAIGRTYLTCDLTWVLKVSSGGEFSWEQLREKENVGWILEGEKVIIRKVKAKTPAAVAKT